MPIPTPISGPSRSPPCAVCSKPSRYTCPRCSAHTCSLPCSTTHKSTKSCDGKRDPAAFIRLRDVGQGVWADDYRYLEEGRRKVLGWGEGLTVPYSRDRQREQGREQGRGQGDGQRNTGNKLDGLKRELRRRGYMVDLMPEGMERRKLNQSSWSVQTKTLYLTVQLSIPFNLLVPKNKTERGPKIINRRVLLASPDSKNLPTLAAQLPKSLAPTDFTFALPFHSPAGPSARPLPVIRKGKMFFPPLDPARPLSETLRRTAWVEFPTIHVIPSQEWQERVKKGEVVIAPLLEPIVASEGRTRDAGWGAKRRAPTEMVGVGKKVKIGVEDVLAALGEYDSDEEEEEGEEVLGGKEGEVVLEALGRAAEADLGDD